MDGAHLHWPYLRVTCLMIILKEWAALARLAKIDTLHREAEDDRSGDMTEATDQGDGDGAAKRPLAGTRQCDEREIVVWTYQRMHNADAGSRSDQDELFPEHRQSLSGGWGVWCHDLAAAAVQPFEPTIETLASGC